MRPTYLDTELNPSQVLRLILSSEEFGEIDGCDILVSPPNKLVNKKYPNVYHFVS